MAKMTYGIDFGTTNSTVAVVDKNGLVQKLPLDPDASNSSIMRSVSYVSKEGAFLYGQKAVEAYLIDVAQGKGRTRKTVFTGRMIKLSGDADIHGFRDDEWVEEIIDVDEFSGGRLLQALKSALAEPFITHLNLFGKNYTLEEIVAGFLKEMKTRADGIVGQEVTSAVIGTPVKYVGKDDNLALSRMKSAALMAGFEDVKFEYEPIGAAYDYGLRITKAQTILVFDFGGGTLDISVVRFPSKEVLSNVGNPLGGDYFNAEIFDSKIASYFGKGTSYGLKQLPLPHYIFDSLQSWYQATLLKTDIFEETIQDFSFMNTNPKAIAALRSLVINNLSFSMYDEIDRVKRSLSSQDADTFSFHASDIDIDQLIKKQEFEEIISEDLKSISETIHTALEKAGVKAENIDAVATTGGSSLIPAVRELLEKTFSKEKIIDNDAFTSVAAGLAVKAASEL